MVICVGGRGAGKTLLLSLLRDRSFNPDSALVSTVGVNIFRLEISVNKKKKEILDIRELGGQLAPVWGDYIKSENSVIFVVDSSNLGQVSLVAVKLVQCLRSLEQRSAESNQVCRLCIVWTRSGDIASISRVIRLKELCHQSSVVTSQIVFDLDSPATGLDQLQSWILTSVHQ